MTTLHRYHDLLHTASRLPTHVLRTMLVLAALAGTGLTLGALSLEMSPTGPTELAPAATPALRSTTAQSGLPTVTLDTVTVRASDAGAAARGTAGSNGTATRPRAASANVAGDFVRRAAGSALTMPYYSFAKPLRASIEE